MEIKNAKYFLELEGKNNAGINAIIDGEKVLVPSPYEKLVFSSSKIIVLY